MNSNMLKISGIIFLILIIILFDLIPTIVTIIKGMFMVGQLGFT